MEDIRTKTKAFLARFFQNVDLQDDQDIFAMGFVNSLFAMQLVLFVENQFGVAVEDDDLDIDNFKSINAIAIASVVPPVNFTLKRMAEDYFHLTPLFIDHTIDTGVPILYQPPSDVGADRIVDAVAAIHKYGAPCIVVDFGTATTFDAINATGEYLGGVITPGITISSDALFERAAKLPRVEIKRPQKVIGSATVEAMQSGLYYGYVGLVDGILQRMIDELGGAPRVIATGGLAALIAKGSGFIETVDETLTLEGLRLVYERTK